MQSVPAGRLHSPALGSSPSLILPKRIAVRQRFTQCHPNLQLGRPQQLGAATNRRSVTKCLNRNYYEPASETANGLRIGSWGKHTTNRPLRDVDLTSLIQSAEYLRCSQWISRTQSTYRNSLELINMCVRLSTDSASAFSVEAPARTYSCCCFSRCSRARSISSLPGSLARTKR